MKILFMLTLLALPAFAGGIVCSGADLKKVKAEVLPTMEESAWLAIPWRTDLWEARKEAARTGKPIYLWEMDGHPLGCV